MATTSEMTVWVDGMTCGGCERRLGTALRRVAGVREVTADHTAGRVRVWFDPEATGPDAVRDRIGLAGYTVRDDGRDTAGGAR